MYEQETRLKLLRRYAANKHRLAVYSKRLPDVITQLRITKLLVQQELLRRQIEDSGGLTEAILEEKEKPLSS